MNKEDWKKLFLHGLQIFMGLAMAIGLYFILLRFDSIKNGLSRTLTILTPFLYGGVMAYLLKTPCNFFDKVFERYLPEKMKKYKTGMSVFVVLAITFFILYTLLRTVVPEVAASLITLTKQIPERIQYFFDWLSEYLKSDGVVQNYVRPVVEDISKKAVEWTKADVLPSLQGMMGNVTSTITSVVTIVMDLGIGLIVCIYILCARRKFERQGKAVIYSIFRPKLADRIMGEMRFIDKTFDGFLSGKILDSAIVGLVCYVFCIIMTLTRGMTNGILISLIIGLTNIIPYFGPFIGAIPCTLLILMSDPVSAVIFLIFIIILQQFDGNILGPKLLAGSVGLSGFWVLFSITIFSGYFGFVGVLVGVPVFAVIFDLLRKLVLRGLERNGKLEILSEPEKKEVFEPKRNIIRKKEKKA